MVRLILVVSSLDMDWVEILRMLPGDAGSELMDETESFCWDGFLGFLAGSDKDMSFRTALGLSVPARKDEACLKLFDYLKLCQAENEMGPKYEHHLFGHALRPLC